MKGVLTKRFLLCVLLGQLLSFSLTATSVITTELGNSGWAIPCSQSLFFYFTLNLLYTPYTMYRYGFGAWARMLKTDSWKYVLLAAIDVEANFLVIKAYGYTDLLSCMMLNAWSTPACMIFAFFLVKARYHWSQVLGALICITGLALIVVSDWTTDKNYPANNRVLGDVLMILGATGYGLSNATEERFVRERPLYEVIGQIGFWGTLINATQGAALEHDLYLTAVWSGKTIGLLIAYTCAMLFLYSCAPILFRLSSSPFYNLSIMTSNFYGLCFGLGLYHYAPYFLYFIAYPLIIVGLLVYFLVQTPESIEMEVVARGKQAEKEKEAGTKKVVGDRV
ncbi:solute carrier family 35 member SLC35F1/F2/F6 [Leucosporidium creatinivorum]|uniref:Solute carrier family 35 member SLC35F1/F2/F6 n=1 Tax=Leucosporidium creatinivorum TaxID=106004 RepID=A0A1Y2E7X9_9BASI|nr:solute carrier family 35 member SLC35F1/F2/F6 [Leucosporidium creatinivorum]